MYELYTDGSCLGNPGPGGVGIVVLKNGEVLAKLSYGDPATTNNRMELEATLTGIAYIRENLSHNDSIVIYTDSRYVVEGMNSWRIRWKEKQWKPLKKNVDLWKMLDAIDQQGPCTYKWVKAHNGNKYNEMANDLAQDAAKEM